jgi:hypothetical protein
VLQSLPGGSSREAEASDLQKCNLVAQRLRDRRSLALQSLRGCSPASCARTWPSALAQRPVTALGDGSAQVMPKTGAERSRLLAQQLKVGKRSYGADTPTALPPPRRCPRLPPDRQRIGDATRSQRPDTVTTGPAPQRNARLPITRGRQFHAPSLSAQLGASLF